MSGYGSVVASRIVRAEVQPNGLRDSWLVMVWDDHGRRQVWAAGFTKAKSEEIAAEVVARSATRKEAL